MKIRQNSLHASSRGTGKATILRHAPRALFSVTRPELKRNYFSSSYLIWEKGSTHFHPSLAFDMKRNAQFQSCLAFSSPIRKAGSWGALLKLTAGEQRFTEILGPNPRWSNTFPSSTHYRHINGASTLRQWIVAKIITKLKPYFKKESKKMKREQWTQKQGHHIIH